MAIITLAKYKELTNTTDTTYDTLISSIIPGIQNQIEEYLDRKLDQDLYKQWYDFHYQLLLEQYPVTRFLYLGTPGDFATFTTTKEYTIEVLDDQISVVDSEFDGDAFTFEDYPTIQDMCDKITTEFPDIIFTIDSDCTDTSTKLLRKGVCKSKFAGAKKLNVAYRILPGTERTLSLSRDGSYNWTYALEEAYDQVIFVYYEAGYTETTMPVGLQMICSNIINDIIANMTAGLNGSALNPFMASERLTNYSYTLASTQYAMDYLKKEFNRYTDSLEPWRKREM